MLTPALWYYLSLRLWELQVQEPIRYEKLRVNVNFSSLARVEEPKLLSRATSFLSCKTLSLL